MAEFAKSWNERRYFFVRFAALIYMAAGVILVLLPQTVENMIPGSTGYTPFQEKIVAVSGVLLIIFGAFFAFYKLKIFSPAYNDERERSFESSLQAAERRMDATIEARLKKISREKIDVDPTLTRLLNDKIDIGLIAAIDNTLKNRASSEARISRTLEFMNEVTLELKNRLEGPGARAETAAGLARFGAYAMAIIGLAVAGYRVYSLGDTSNKLMDLLKTVGDKPLWPIIAAQAAPYVGFVLLAEFTALLFLRFSNQSIALQRYFTEGLAQLRDRHLAMRFIVEFGSEDEIVSAALRMIEASNRELTFTDEAKKDESALAKAATSLKEKTSRPRSKASAGKSAAKSENA